MPTRVLPNNIEAEESVLGACFLSKYALQKAAENLSEEAFYSEKNSKIFATMLALLEEKTPIVDMVNHPSHYTSGSIECIDAMIETQGVEAVKQYCKCNAFKYLWRHSFKNGEEDIDKARWYLNEYVKLRDGDTAKLEVKNGDGRR